MIDKEINDLRKKIKYSDKKDNDMIDKAFYLLKTNVDNHLIYETVKMLFEEYHASADIICAELLYQCVSEEEIENVFDKSIVDLVKKLKSFDAFYIKLFGTEKDKVLRTITDDVRVVIIKLIERYNIITKLNKNNYGANQIIDDTLSFYVKIAELLGMYKLKYDLENVCFKYDYNYRTITKIKESINKRSVRSIQTLKSKAKKENIPLENIDININERSLLEIYGRLNDFIVKTMKLNNEILGFCSIKCVTETKQQCYQMLYLIHQFIPIAGSFNDYLLGNGINEYKAIHTNAFINSLLIDFRIFTKEMDKINLYGVASYLDKKINLQSHLQNNYAFYNRLVELVQNGDENIADKILSNSEKTK